MSGKPSRGRPKNEKLTEELLNFLAEKSKHATSPLNITQLSRDFLENSKWFQKTTTVADKMRKLCPEMSKLKDFDVETKVRMLFALSAPICADFLNELRNDAIVEVDEKKRITKYKEKYGSLELNGDHSNSAKCKAFWAEKKRNRSQSYASDHSEESGRQYGKEVKCKSGWAERQKERREYCSSDEDEVDQKAYTSNIKNIKMSNSTSNIDFTSGNSEFKCSIGENVKRQRIAKTEMSKHASNFASSSEIPQYKKRRLNTRTVKMIQRDVIYDGPGEPPRPILLPPKREPTEYDHIDFYSNQYYYGTGDNRVDNVELGSLQESSEYGSNRNYEIGNTQYFDGIVKIEPEDPDIICDTTFVPVNTSSCLLNHEIQRNRIATLTSSKKFLEGIRILVLTLDSPWLTKLQKKIENSIKTFEEEDQKIPTDDILTILNGCLLIISKNTTWTSSEASTSLKQFLLILRSALYTLNSPDFDNFQQKIKDAIDELGDSDKKVPISKIRSALETVVEVAAP